ncbi:MAG: GTA-gp10 family protein [Robiginitomaculum sp.]
MSGFQAADVSVHIEGKAYTLRLTLGALLEISEKLKVLGPRSLAQKLKEMGHDQSSAKTVAVLLEALLRPALKCVPYVDVSTLANKAIPVNYLPAITQVFERSFTESNGG